MPLEQKIQIFAAVAAILGVMALDWWLRNQVAIRAAVYAGILAVFPVMSLMGAHSFALGIEVTWWWPLVGAAVGFFGLLRILRLLYIILQIIDCIAQVMSCLTCSGSGGGFSSGLFSGGGGSSGGGGASSKW